MGIISFLVKIAKYKDVFVIRKAFSQVMDLIEEVGETGLWVTVNT